MNKLPEFSLPDRRGGMGGTEDLLQRRDMVLAVVHGGGCEACGPLLDELARQSSARDMTGAAALAIVEGAGAVREDAPFSVLEDRDGSIGRKLAASVDLGASRSFVVVADRFGAPVAAKPVHGTDPKDLVADAFDWIDFVEMQCPECGVAD